jgi:hypothetical protein
MAMNNGETNTRDTGVVGAYRAASEALDERPRADTRAAILAAAARAVDAQPQDAETGATSRRTQRRSHDRHNLIGPSKRPLALVASFLVATVALVLATQTREEIETKEAALERGVLPEIAPMVTAPTSQQSAPIAEQDLDLKREANGPTMSIAASNAALKDKADATNATGRPDERAREDLSGTAARATTSGNLAMRGEPQTPTPPPTAMVVPTPAAPSAQTSPATTAPSRSTVPAAPPMATEPAQQRQRSMSAAAEAPPPVARREAADAIDSTRAQLEAPNSAVSAARPAAGVAEQRAKEMQKLKLRADRTLDGKSEPVAEGRLAKARPVERTAALSADSVESDPARWMERIIALREGGHDEEADRELARLRERFPDVTVPPNALRRTGTR